MSSNVSPLRPAIAPAAAPAPAPTPQAAHATFAAKPVPGRGRTSLVGSAPDAAAGAATGGLRTPDWVKDAIFYQVFPERFANGDTSNDPAGTVPWGTPPQNDQFFMGGDLNGVSRRLDHIKRLGANALYLNPVFEAPSNHKYDTTDYHQVDDNFGGNAAFTELVDKAHAGGVKIMLDGVLNHTSHESVWFKDVKERGKDSPYWSWYTVDRWPITTWRDDRGVLRSNDYRGWGKPEWGGPYATLPELNNLHPEVMDGLVTGPDSVVRKWLRDGKIDGWRMDVADEVEPEVWRRTREVVKAENPDAYLLGENWHDASDMLKGDQFDGVMNYKYFQQPAVDFFARKGIRPDDFVGRLQNGYSPEAKLSMLNVLDSHDTPRFISQAGGDWYRLRPAAIFQMTYQGAPVVYYGDEIGMEGGADPDSRRAFDWGVADSINPPATHASLAAAAPQVADLGAVERGGQLFGLYQRLIDARKGSDALRRGDFEVLATHNDDNTIAYRRAVAGDARDAIVALNNNVVERAITVPAGRFAPDGTAYVDALSGARYSVSGGTLQIPRVDGNYGAVLLREPA
jgi:cyclomaltodextrinase / maltogenic alpha-amylase / neopullulanase